MLARGDPIALVCRDHLTNLNRRTAAPCRLRASDGCGFPGGVDLKDVSERDPRSSLGGICRAFSARGTGCMTGESPSPKTGRRAVVEIPNSAGEIMTKDVVSALVGTSVRDVAILLLEKRISAIPVLAANLQLVGMVSEGDLIGRSDADRVARRDWWLTLLTDVQPQTETFAALAARPVEQVMRAPVLTIEARAPLHEIAEMLKVYDIKRLPVMRGDRMVGIVSRSDLARAVATQIPKPTKGESVSGLLPGIGPESFDVAQIVYTSGTESRPKGVQLTHDVILWQYVSCMTDASISGDDVALHVLPLYHCAQLDVFLGPPIYAGGVNIVTAKPVPDNIFVLVERDRATSFFAPPTVWISMLRSPGFDLADLSSLRKGYYGASIMPVEVLRELKRRLPEAMLSARVSAIIGLEARDGSAVICSK